MEFGVGCLGLSGLEFGGTSVHQCEPKDILAIQGLFLFEAREREVYNQFAEAELRLRQSYKAYRLQILAHCQPGARAGNGGNVHSRTQRPCSSVLRLELQVELMGIEASLKQGGGTQNAKQPRSGVSRE